MFLGDGRSVRKQIEQAARQGERIDLAIAYWGAGAVDELALACAARGTRVLVDATSGGTNPDALRALMACGQSVSVRHLRGLHAKVAITSECVIVGSANASAAGFGFSPEFTETHVEAAAVLRAREELSDAGSWFDEQWDRGVDVTESILASAMAAWMRRTRARLAETDGEEPPAEGVFVVVYGTHADPGVIEDAEKRLFAEGEQRASAYQGWSKMPRDAVLFDFWVERQGPVKAKFQGVYQSFPDPERKATRSSDGREVTVYAVRSVARPAERLAQFGFTERSLGRLIESLIASYDAHHGRGAPAEFRRAGGEYAHLRDWCMRIDRFLALCAARGVTRRDTGLAGDR